MWKACMSKGYGRWVAKYIGLCNFFDVDVTFFMPLSYRIKQSDKNLWNAACDPDQIKRFSLFPFVNWIKIYRDKW